MDMFDIYTEDLENKLRTEGIKREELAFSADHLEEKKAEFKELLKEMKFTYTDMKSPFTNEKGWIYRGIETNNRLRNTNGICIYPNGQVFIGYFNGVGDLDVSKLYIRIDKY